jgi:hypothetical protein
LFGYSGEIIIVKDTFKTIKTNFEKHNLFRNLSTSKHKKKVPKFKFLYLEIWNLNPGI